MLARRNATRGSCATRALPARCRTVVPPAQQASQDPSHYRPRESITSFVVGEHVARLRVVNVAEHGLEMIASDRDFRQPVRVKVAVPISPGTEARHHHCLVPVPVIAQHFEHGLVSSAGLPPHVTEHQEPVSENPTQMPVVQRQRSTQHESQRERTGTTRCHDHRNYYAVGVVSTGLSTSGHEADIVRHGIAMQRIPHTKLHGLLSSWTSDPATPTPAPAARVRIRPSSITLRVTELLTRDLGRVLVRTYVCAA